MKIERYKAMKSVKSILFIVAIMISVSAAAVEYAKPYRSAYPTTTRSAQELQQQEKGFRQEPGLLRSGSAYSSTITNIGATNNNGGGTTDGGSYSPARGPRRIESNGDGSYEGEINGDKVWDGEEWVPIPLNQTKIGDDGYVYQWNGSSWVKLPNQKDPDSPIGATPWVLMMLLLGGYAALAAYRRREA